MRVELVQEVVASDTVHPNSQYKVSRGFFDD